jgi:hypothetical protein
MRYLYIITAVESIEDEIDLPYFLFDMITRYVEGMIQGNLSSDVVGQMVANEISKLTQSETSGPIERPMPFFV